MNLASRWALAWLVVILAGCASPVEGLWPPAKGTPAHQIIVSLDSWHAMIALPRTSAETRVLSAEMETSDLPRQYSASASQHSALSPLPADLSAEASAKAGQHSESSSQHSALSPQHFLFEEWGYAEEAWYLERRMGSGGVMRALFIESPAVVEVGRYDRLLSERTLDPPADQYTLYLSDEGYRRLRRHLEATIADPTPIHATSQAKFYRAKEPYYWTHHCHHYAAHALRAAGLPISSFWALTRDMLASQLERAVQMAAESDNKPPDEPR